MYLVGSEGILWLNESVSCRDEGKARAVGPGPEHVPLPKIPRFRRINAGVSTEELGRPEEGILALV